MLLYTDKLLIFACLLYIIGNIFWRQKLYEKNEDLAKYLQQDKFKCYQQFMIIISLLGSAFFIAPISMFFYFLNTNRIKALSFTLYISAIVYINAVSKNIYHDSRPFMTYSSIKGIECQSEFGNPSGKFIQKGHSFGTFCFYYYFYHQYFIKNIVKAKFDRLNGKKYNNFFIKFTNQKILLLIAHLLIATFLFLIGFSRVYLGVHSFDQILLGWCQGMILLTLYLKHFKKRSHRILKIQAIYPKDTGLQRQLLKNLQFISFFLLILTILVEILLNNLFKLPDNELYNYQKACGNIPIQKYLQNKSFIETGFSFYAFGTIYAVIKTKGSYNKQEFKFNYSQMSFINKIKRFLIQIMHIIVLIAPFQLITFDNIYFIFLIKALLPSIIYGQTQFSDLQQFYQYFNVKIKGDFLLFSLDDVYSQI